jgi:type II secretory pathway pseudopilin PulG
MSARGAAARLLCASAIGLVAGLPLLLHGASCGQDFDFHLQSWLAVRAAWHTGVWSPHWVSAANYGAGEPRFLFYPPLSWLLGALLSFVFFWAWVPWAFSFLCFAGAAWSMHRAARRFASPLAAWLAAVVYALSPYLLFTGYERGALAELLAAVWMPPLFIALLESRLPVLRIAALLAALWYTNAPAAVMGCYLVLLALVWRSGVLLLKRSPAKPATASLRAAWLRGIAALALGCALSADYLFPAWFEQRFVTIERAVGPGMRVEDSFLFEHTGQAYHDQVLHTASSIAVATLAAGLLLAGLLFWLRRRKETLPGTGHGASMRSRAVGFLCATLVICALLQLRPSDFLWHLLPQFAFLQFPWRLLLPASAAAGLLLALALPTRLANTRRATAIALASGILYAIALMLWTARTRFQPCDDQDNVAAQQLLPGAGAGFEGTDEYAAKDTDNGEIQQDLPKVRLLASPGANEGDDTSNANPEWQIEPKLTIPGSILVTGWSAEQRSVQVRPQSPAYAVLLLERSRDWTVLLDGRPCSAHCIARDDGLVTVAVPSGRTSVITARFITPWDVWLGRAISLLAGLLLVLIAWRRRHQGRRRARGRPGPPL